jgi:AcrR family transcriptional regulator
MKRKERTHPLEQRIIDVSLKCIYKYGLSNSTIRFIAKEAKIKPTAIQYYFPLKENLINKLIENIHEEIISSIESSYSPLDPPEIKLQKVLKNLEIYLLKRKVLQVVYITLLLAEGIRNPLSRRVFVEKINRVLNTTKEVLKEGAEKGVFNEVNIDDVARSFIIFARGCAIQGLLEKTNKYIKRDINFFFENIKKILFK